MEKNVIYETPTVEIFALDDVLSTDGSPDVGGPFSSDWI